MRIVRCAMCGAERRSGGECADGWLNIQVSTGTLDVAWQYAEEDVCPGCRPRALGILEGIFGGPVLEPERPKGRQTTLDGPGEAWNARGERSG
jgi:hypothetical protein